MDKIYVKERTVYGVLEALDGLFSPGTTKFSDYVKLTSDDNGFLRTAWTRKQLPFKNKQLPREITHIVVGSKREIDEKLLRWEWTDEPFGHEQTLSKFQIIFTDARSAADEVELNHEFGYNVNYVVQIE